MKHGKSLKVSKAFYLASFILCILLQAGIASAQSPRIKHVVDMVQKDKTQSLGRDLWFTMAQNYESQGGKYYALYVTSPNNTTVNIQVTGGSTSKWPITAGQVLTFNVPLAWEVTTSGVVESKAIRVWSNNADLTAYLLSRNPYTSDGMMIIPTIGWGKEYVVAAYASLYEGYGNFVYDYPSEFSIVANQNNTVCLITPSIDLRNQGTGPAIRKQGIPFTEVLQQGQCVQYKAVPALNEEYDVTGSIITSNNPVGIVGASQCPNIPVWFPYCDHICDMIPPVRTWAQTYQTVPFANRRGGDTYLVVGSKPGQTIQRNRQVYCVLTNKYASYFRGDIEDASLWESDAPFLLAQYINSTTWTDVNGKDNAGVGDPAMVVVNSLEQYVPKIIFQTPNIQGAGGFTNFCNVMVNNKTVTTTLFDGKPINSVKGATRMLIPFSNYTAFRISSVQPGTHTIVSDSGAGVYVYGYGNYDSYAWSGSLGIKTFNDPDTIPPVALPSGDCFTAYVSLTDNHKIPPASLISEMKIDSFYNMVYAPDPNYLIGVATEQTFYSMNVIDSSKEAYLKIETHDYAGNRTIITSTYIPQTATLTPSIQNYGSGNVGVETCKNFTVTNTGKTIITWEYTKLLIGTKGFAIKNLDNSPLAPGASRDIMVCFTPPTPKLASDTLELFDGCMKLRATVVGTGGQPDFLVSDDDFGCQVVGSITRESKSTIVNTSKSYVTIDSIYVDDKIHFGFDPTTPPSNILSFQIPANGQHPIEFTFTPDKIGSFTTLAHFHSVEIGWKTATLIGCGIAPGASISKDTLQISQCGAAVPFAFTIKSIGKAPTIIDRVVVVGNNFGPAGNYTNQAGQPVNLPIQLGTDEQFIAYTTFTPPAKASGRFTANVFAISDKNDTTNLVTATVDAIWREIRIGTDAVTMPVVPFGSAPIGSSFQFCNDFADPVSITSMTPVPGPYSAAFSITNFKVGGVVKTLPFSLAKGECVDIGVDFNPSVSPDSMQTAYFSLSTDACFPYFKATATAGVKLGPPTIQGFGIPTILSCDTKTSTVDLTNSNGPSSPAMKITNITVQGPNAGNFIAQNPPSMDVPGGTTTKIPVVFTPTAGAGPNPTNYSAVVVVTLTDASGKTVTLNAPVTGSANGMSAEVSSNFAVQSAQADASTILRLPIDIKFTKNGLSDPVDAFGITKIRLVYTYNTNILELAGGTIASSVTPANGWTVDPASSLDITTGTLTLILNGNAPLNDATSSLGEIRFYPTLTRSDTKSTTVNLTSSDLLTSGGAAVGNCLAVSQKGTQFALVYSCGDSTLAYFLRTGNAPSMIKPINPNPVTSVNGGIVSFQYVTRHEGIVSILIYDELGKEVGRVVSGQYHPAGTYEVHFDASHLSSGSYIYRFQLDRHHAISGRMVVGN